MHFAFFLALRCINFFDFEIWRLKFKRKSQGKLNGLNQYSQPINQSIKLHYSLSQQNEEEEDKIISEKSH